jgi:hypothetical protein
MNKENIKKLIKRQLWDSRYKITDIENLIAGIEFDLLVNKKYRIKIIMPDSNCMVEIKRYVTDLAVLARIQNGKKEYAGGAQKVPNFTTNFREVLK